MFSKASISRLLPLLAMLTTFSADGQSDSTALAPQAKRFFEFTPGYALQQGRDEGMSPLTYRGGHFNGLLALEKTKQGRFNRVELSAAFGQLRPPRQPELFRSRALALRLQLDYCHERLLSSWRNGQLRLFLGGAWNNLLNVIWHQRYLNNSLNYVFSSGIGPSGSLRYNFQIGKKAFEAYAQLQLPLLAFNLRPAYASSLPEGFIAQDRSNVRAFFDSGRLQSLNGFFRLRNNLAVHYRLKNNNAVLLTYRWDYYDISQRHRVRMAIHQILIGWRYRF